MQTFIRPELLNNSQMLDKIEGALHNIEIISNVFRFFHSIWPFLHGHI